jgi:hypothetical protein
VPHDDALPVPTSTLLAAWERGLNADPWTRSTALLAVAPGGADTDPGRLSAGARDARLLDLRERLFGSRLTGTVACPACGERLEITLETAQIRATAPRRVGDAETVVVGSYVLRFRLPTLDDVAGARRGDRDAFRRELLARCVLSVTHDDVPATLADVPPAVVTALVDRMGELDPQADVRIGVSCPACRHAWQPRVDVPSFLWSELDVWVRRLLCEVHALATAYGWREPDVLGLTPARRRFYLDLVGAP